MSENNKRNYNSTIKQFFSGYKNEYANDKYKQKKKKTLLNN